MMNFYPPSFYLGASGNVADGYGEKTDIVSSYFHSSFFKDLNSIFDLKKNLCAVTAGGEAHHHHTKL